MRVRSRMRDRMTRIKQDRIEELRKKMAAAPLMEQKLIFREQIKVRHERQDCLFCVCTVIVTLMHLEQKIYDSVA